MSWKSFLYGIASIFDFVGCLGPTIDDVLTDEEAFEYNRKKLEEDWQNILPLYQENHDYKRIGN